MADPQQKFKHLDEEGGHGASETIDPAALRRRYITVSGFIAVLVLLVFGIVLATRQGEDLLSTHAKNVIIFFADGMSLQQVAMARAAFNQSFLMDSFLAGSLITYSNTHWISDAAAGSTALSCGMKTDNSFIGVYRSQTGAEKACGTILEASLTEGRAVGVATNGLLTAPIVSSWLAHSKVNDPVFLGKQMLSQEGLDLLLGGGGDYLKPLNEFIDNYDWHRMSLEEFTRMCAANKTESKEEKIEWPVLGVFAGGRFDYAIDRETKRSCGGLYECPSLKEMTKASLEMLSQSDKAKKKGFTLAVFNARMGHASRANDAAALYHEIVDLDDAIEEAYHFAREEGNEKTLIVVVSPYDAGGLSFSRDGSFETTPERISKVERSIAYLAELLAKHNTTSREQIEAIVGVFGIEELNESEFIMLRDANTVSEHTNALLTILNSRFRIRWTSTNPTGTDTPFYVYGYNAEEFRGSMENSEMGQAIAKAAQLSLEDETTKRFKEQITP